MWQHRSTTERLDGIEKFFERLFGRPDDDKPRHSTDPVIHFLQQMEKRLMASIEDLKAAVARETAVEDSVVTLLNGISQQLKDLKAAPPAFGGQGIDPAALDEIIAGLDANTAKLGAAVTANT